MAAGSTYSTIATTTLGAATGTVTFSSISGAYTDLVLVISGQGSAGGAQGLFLRFNGDTATNYSDTELSGNGTSASSGRDTSVTGIRSVVMDSANITTDIINIMNYSNTTTYKSVLVRSNTAGTLTKAGVGLWRSTSAITSIDLVMPTNNFNIGSTFTLYGIAAA